MNYRTFSDYQLGYSHVKKGTACEDYAMSYSEPSGRYHICVACDGHSDNNCFRSSKGARFGCESAIEILKRFFELYYEQEAVKKDFSPETEERLKKSIKQCWDRKIFEDIKENPITQEELQPLTERVRSIYESGRGLQNIYGATFLAAAMCEEFFVAMHIGDGIVMCVSPDGTYYEPLPNDEKSETGSPASLCDSDLFSRKEAFRCAFSSNIPQAVIVSSDGVGDCMDNLQFREFTRALIGKFETMEQESQENELNLSQKKYLENCLKYWADKGHGVEDDCSLAGIYDWNKEIPKVKIPLDMALQLWNDAAEERNHIVQDYGKRKAEMVRSIDKQMETAANILKATASTRDWIAAKDKIEQLKQILRNMQNNEREKLEYCDRKLEICKEYIKRAQGTIPADKTLLMPRNIDEKYLTPDELFIDLKNAKDSLQDKSDKNDKVDEDLETAENTDDYIEDDIENIFEEEAEEESDQYIPKRFSKSKRKTMFSLLKYFWED